MSIIVISPAVTDEGNSSQKVLDLQVTLSQSEFEGLFDRLQVWRSEEDSLGPYEELTSDSWSAARIPETAGDVPTSVVTGESVEITGKELELRVDESTDITITFTGPDPVTFAAAATQVTDQGLGKVRAYVDEDGTFVAESTKVGSGASLRVLESDGAAILGLPTTEPDSLAFGKEARIPLLLGVERYAFRDLRGSADYFYKTRPYNSSDQSVGEFSRPFKADFSSGLADHLTQGRLDLVSLRGKPLRNIEVSIYNAFQSELVEGKFIAESQTSKKTDNNGSVAFILVRGAKVSVSISGTDIVRDIVVPTDPNVHLFNLLDPEVGVGKGVFTVQVPEIIYAERRSL